MSASLPVQASSSGNADAAEIRKLLEREDFTMAASECERLLASSPEHRDALYMLGVAQRYLQKIPEALATLERLEQLYPAFSRLYQERGHCHVARRDAPRAIDAFQNAVSRNPALPASWRQLQTLYRMTGQLENAELAASHLQVSSKLAPEVLAATGLFCDGDVLEAERLIRSYLLRPGHAQDIEAMRLLARIAIGQDIAEDADFILEAVLELAPDYHAARYDHACALMRRHKYRPAVEQMARLLQVEPGNRVYRTTYATACVGLGEHEKALGLYRALLEETPRHSDLHLSIAHTLKTLGQHTESVAAYRKAAEMRPDFGDAYWSLANLKTYRFPDEEIVRMRDCEAAASTHLVDRYHLCFALGKALEDRGEYEQSFRYYERGNGLRKSESRYQAELVERNTRLQKAVCTREFFERRAGYGYDAVDPIFIVGLPRSGSTLLEQILASHSQVEGTMELAEIAATAFELEGRNRDMDDPRYPRVLGDLTAEDCRRLGEKYIRDTQAYRTGKAYFIDKMPNNFRHLGLIHLILPRAKIIDARRDPMACSFSNFKQLFASGQEFTYSIDDIARYYRTYVELMDHWATAMPGKILRVRHENVVENLDANVHRLLEFCGLPFEPACLTFWKTERSVRTASSEQVRQPIFREGLDQWRKFEPWLGPLKAALGHLARD